MWVLCVKVQASVVCVCVCELHRACGCVHGLVMFVRLHKPASMLDFTGGGDWGGETYAELERRGKDGVIVKKVILDG